MTGNKMGFRAVWKSELFLEQILGVMSSNVPGYKANMTVWVVSELFIVVMNFFQTVLMYKYKRKEGVYAPPGEGGGAISTVI